MGFFQVLLGESLNGPSDYQAGLVGFVGFGDDVEVDVRNDLGNRPSMKDYKQRVMLSPPGERSSRYSDGAGYISGTDMQRVGVNSHL